jgi:hypothetical protein
MARAKPRYTGKPHPGVKMEEFSDDLKKALKDFYPNPEAVEDEVWGHPSDRFVREILVATDWTASELHFMQDDVTTGEIHLEFADLLNSLKDSEKKLQTISPDLDRLISIDADPRGCSENIREIIAHLDDARHLIEKLPKSKRPEQKKNPLAKEMIMQVIEVLNNYGISATAWVDEKDKTKPSATIQILKMIGDEIGLSYDVRTWQRFIGEVKKGTTKEEGAQLAPKK